MLPTLMMRPEPASAMCGTTSLLRRIGAQTLVSNVALAPLSLSTSASSMAPVPPCPALLTRMSRRPCSETMRLMADSHDSAGEGSGSAGYPRALSAQLVVQGEAQAGVPREVTSSASLCTLSGSEASASTLRADA